MEWYKAHPDYDRQRWIKRRPEVYGLTVEQFQKLEIRFGSKCGICGRHTKMNIDHDHLTGRVRGLLCLQCNAKLGVIENEEWMLKATEYLVSASN